MLFTVTEDLPSLVHYHWITDQIAVGSLYSSYKEFDIIVNLAYVCDGDGFVKHEITSSIESGKLIMKVGLYDSPNEPLDRILSRLIPILVNYIRIDPETKVLVHCQAGKSRSGSVAIALIATLTNLPFEEVLSMVKIKRPIIQPNDGFSFMIKQFLENTK